MKFLVIKRQGMRCGRTGLQIWIHNSIIDYIIGMYETNLMNKTLHYWRIERINTFIIILLIPIIGDLNGCFKNIVRMLLLFISFLNRLIAVYIFFNKNERVE